VATIAKIRRGGAPISVPIRVEVAPGHRRTELVVRDPILTELQTVADRVLALWRLGGRRRSTP
jgi:hypothetical protein